VIWSFVHASERSYWWHQSILCAPLSRGFYNKRWKRRESSTQKTLIWVRNRGCIRVTEVHWMTYTLLLSTKERSMISHANKINTQSTQSLALLKSSDGSSFLQSMVVTSIKSSKITSVRTFHTKSFHNHS
jgi:hypothetical protein